MRHAPSRATLLQRIVLAAVAVALVGAQVVGLHHRVEHFGLAGWASAAIAVDAHETHPASPDHDDGSPEHSCAAVDAAATGNALALAAVEIAPAPVEDNAITRSSAEAIALARRAPFDARAPPAFTA